MLSLALGIGANAALFSFVNAILLKQLPVPQAMRLLVLKNAGKPLRSELPPIERSESGHGGDRRVIGNPSTRRQRNASEIVHEWVSAELVTGEYFHTLQIKPERGRLLSQRDLDDAEGNPACIISYRLWKSHFRGAEDVIGRTIFLNTRPYQIVGVSERGFSGTDLQRPADLQIPATRLIDYMPAFVGIPNFDWKSRLSLFSADRAAEAGGNKGRRGWDN